MTYGILGDWKNFSVEKSVKTQITNNAQLLPQLWWSPETQDGGSGLRVYMG